LFCFAWKKWKIDDGAICQSFPLGSPLSRVNSRYPTNAIKKHLKETNVHNWHKFPKKKKNQFPTHHTSYYFVSHKNILIL
jgi:hypothetical protein